MKKNSLIACIITILFFIPLTAESSLFFSEGKKAQELIFNALDKRSKGMQNESNALFREAEGKIILAFKENENDPEAYYATGLLHFFNNRPDEAKLRFDLACQYDKSMFDRTFEFYRSESKKAENRGDTKSSIDLVVRSYSFCLDRSRALIAAQQFFEVGSKYLENDCEFSKGKWYFDGAITLEPSLKPKCALKFVQSVKCTSNFKNYLDIYYWAYEFDQGVVLAHLEQMGEGLEHFDVKQEEARPYIQRFPHEIQIIIIKIRWPPDYQLYKKGEIFTFHYKANQYSHYLRSDDGVRERYQLAFGKFEVCIRNDKCYEPHLVPNSTADSRIHAVTDVSGRVLFE